MATRRVAGRRIGVSLIKSLTIVGMLAAGTLASAPPAAAAPDAAIVVDAKTGKTLYASAADSERYPASLTKMMTLYLLFEALDGGRTRLEARIKVSAHAAAQAPSKLGLKAGQTISVRDAILSLVTKSANDMAVAIGEYLAGSETAFARQMTNKAHELGMASTTFRNASGLPNRGQVTTARDMATLGLALREHYPEYYSFFSTRSFVWNGVRISNHNPLLGKVAGVDGIKTGYTRASGYNLVSSVQRNGREIVAVVIGGETTAWRDRHMAELIEKYLARASAGAHVAAAIPGGPSASTLVALTDYPAPRLRPDDGDTVVLASVASIIGADTSFAPQTAEGDAAVGDEVEASQAPTTAASGWRIQIAATPTRAAAEELLDHALSTASSILADASPYTETVAVGDSTLYRARFAGFANQQAARAACAYLVKRHFECLALGD